MKRMSKALCAFLALAMVLTVMPGMKVPAKADEELSIKKFSVSLTASQANEEINKELQELGVSDKIEIPDGYQNIIWVIFNLSLSAGDKVTFNKSTSYNNRFSKAKEFTVSSDGNDTAGNRVFWIAAYFNNQSSSLLKDDTHLAALSWNTKYTQKAQVKVTGTTNNVQSSDIPLDLIRCHNITSSQYKNPDNAFAQYLLLTAGQSVKLADYQVPLSAGKIFDHYTLDEAGEKTSGETEKGGKFENGIYTAPSGDEPEFLELYPQFIEAASYTITVNSQHGSVSVVNSEQVGIKVNLTIVPESGYVVETVSATYGNESTPVPDLTGNGNNWNFTMPEGNVNIDVTYTRVYTVTVNQPSEGGTASASVTKGIKEGMEVTLTLTPERGYEAGEVTATYGDNLSVVVNGEGNTRTFDMPAGDVTVNVTFNAMTIHNVTAAEAENGSVNPENDGEYYKDEKVTVKIAPEQGYQLENIYYTVGEDEEHHDLKIEGVTKATFTMPDADVTIYATFAEAERITVVETALLTDRPGNTWNAGITYEAYNGQHYDDSNVEDSENPIVGTYKLSEPETAYDGSVKYTHYTLTAENLRKAAHVSEENLRDDPNIRSKSYGYYIGVTLSPCDGGTKSYSRVRYSQFAATSRSNLVVMAETAWLTYANPQPVTIYIQLDPENLEKEYWVGVLWGGNNADSVATEYIRLTLDVDCLPITHTYETPDPMPAGFSGEEAVKTTYGDSEREGKAGFKKVETPADLGWTFPATWTWHWLMDGSTTVSSNVKDLTTLESNGFGHYYDHTFQLVFDKIPQKEVKIDETMTGGTITLAQGDQEYTTTQEFNDGSTITITPKANEGQDFSKLYVDGEDVTAKMVNGSYELTVSAPVTVKAVFISVDDTISAINVNGHTASHDNEKHWSITLPWNEQLPEESTESFTFTFKSGSQTVTFKSATVQSDENVAAAKQYIFTVGETDYTVDVKVARRKTFTLTVSVDHATAETKEIQEEDNLTVTLVPSFGYTVPAVDGLTVTVGTATLRNTDYSYDPDTGVLTIPGEHVTGDVTVNGACAYGWVKVLVKANNNEVTYSENGVEQVNPVSDMSRPAQNGNVPVVELRTSMKDKSASEGANQFMWEIPEWLNFEGWYVNEDENGNPVTDEDKYTRLKDTDDEGNKLDSVKYQPQKKNPTPIIIAKWGKPQDTFELQVRIKPGGNNDVYYAADAAEHAGELVTSENLTTLHGKALAKAGNTVTVNFSADYEREGYRSSGWATSSGESLDGEYTVTYEKDVTPAVTVLEVEVVWSKLSTEVAGSIHVPAVFKPGEGGLGADYVTELVVLPETVSTADVALPTVERAGFTLAGDYEFTGWKIEGADTVFSEGIDRATLLKYQNSGVTFVAQWNAVEPMDIRYSVDPGKLPGAERVSRTLLASADPRTVTLPTTTEGVAKAFGWTTTGYEFLGWESSDERIDLSFEYGDTETAPFRPIEGMTVTALWGKAEDVETWTVSFDPGVGGSGTMEKLSKRVDKTNPGWTIEVPPCGFTAPEGMTFSHWTVDGKRVSTSTYEVEKQETVFTANWKTIPDTVVRIYFRANGGSGTMQSAEVSIPWNEESATYTLPACTITAPSGQTFAGWKYGNSILSPGSMITVDRDDTSVELTAQWRPVSSVPSAPGTGGSGTSAGNNPVITPEPSAQPDNGEVESNVHSAGTGDTVTVLPTPDSRYMTGKVTVLDKNGNEVPVTWNGDGTYSFEMPAGGVTVTAEFVTPDEVYEDVEAGDWYLADVAAAANYGLMTGISDTDFGPDETATRAQMLTVLARRSHVPGSWDGGEDWYKAGLDWAVNEGVSDGTRPFDALTRAEIVTMLYRYVGSPKVSGNELGKYADGSGVDAWAREAMEWALEKGIIKGYGDGTLGASDLATRAQLAAILSRVMALVEEF